MKFLSKLTYFHWQICIWKCRLPKWRPSCPGLNVLSSMFLTAALPMRWICSLAILSIWHIQNSRVYSRVKTLRQGQNGRHFADDILKWIFLNENVWIPIKISLKFVPKGPINNIPALDQIMAWRRPGDKPLSELMMVRLPTHICVTRLQWIKRNYH